MSERSLRGQVAIVGIGETTYYKRGQAPDAEFKLALEAILKACEDVGISPSEVDGFASYSNDRNDPPRLAAALGIPELRFSNMQWGGGGGGSIIAISPSKYIDVIIDELNKMNFETFSVMIPQQGVKVWSIN